MSCELVWTLFKSKEVEYMLTKDRLNKKVTEWRNMNWIGASDDCIKRLCESLEDEIVEIAKEAYNRGLEGKAF